MMVESECHTKEENLRQKQTFSEYMRDFLTSNSAKTVVEIGSDVQLRIALRLAPYCTRFCSVNFPEDHERMRGWHEMHREMGGVDNIELISGNALKLSELIPQADVIILHNVLLSLTQEDTDLVGKYIRKEIKYSDEEREELVSRLNRAKEEGYREFLKVAKGGHIVTFIRLVHGANFDEFLINTLGIDRERIEKKELFYDDTEELWAAYIIDNT